MSGNERWNLKLNMGGIVTAPCEECKKRLAEEEESEAGEKVTRLENFEEEGGVPRGVSVRVANTGLRGIRVKRVRESAEGEREGGAEEFQNGTAKERRRDGGAIHGIP